MNKVPQTIKVKVIQQWLFGLSRNHISKINEIGAGTVTAIIKEFHSDIPDLDLLRKVAMVLKRNDLSLFQFAAAIRLKNVLSILAIQEEQVESFIENINVHCFKKSIDHILFIQKVEEISLLLHRYGIPFDNLISLYEEKRKAVVDLSQQEQHLKNNIDKLYNEFEVTKEDLGLYYIERNLNPVLKKKEKELEEAKRKISELEKNLSFVRDEYGKLKFFRMIDRNELATTNENIQYYRPLTEENLQKLFTRLFRHPSGNINIIQILLKRYPELIKDN